MLGKNKSDATHYQIVIQGAHPADRDGMIDELRLSLKGAISEESRIGPLMRAGVPLSPRCRGGRVDEAGFE